MAFLWSCCSAPKTEVEELVSATPLQPNPPTWPQSVRVFSSADSKTTIEEAVNSAYSKNGGPNDHGQFSSDRFAFLFMPGSYDADVPVGYYTQVLGLGSSPDDVVFTGGRGVYSPQGSSDYRIGALSTFWRSGENFRNKAGSMLWAVSQACPLRRVHVDHSLALFEVQGGRAGYASGGFLADSLVGTVELGSQQQWMSRNVTAGSITGGAWNIVSVGCTGAPAYSESHTTVDKTPLIAEKPYITCSGNSFQLRVPAVSASTQGCSWQLGQPSSDRIIDFSRVYVADSASDTATSINTKLKCDAIDAVVLCPGIYELDAPITLARGGQVLLGLGMATLVAAKGNVAVLVPPGLPDVRVAGLLLQAGTMASPALLQWGSTGDAGPGFLHDIFARVGGPDKEQVCADKLVHILSDNVIGDNFWLWRADHTINGEVKNMINPVKKALVVDGNDVKMYGLACEHTLEDLTVWNGNGGQTFFYQSELPYDVDQASFGSKGYAGYLVAPNVTSHQLAHRGLTLWRQPGSSTPAFAAIGRLFAGARE
eukprot:TRINITY_DN25467_c0_g3_i1.p1 TRINITY_DN25467_c0_g3~~TRINITY_DN25467_c0_g3_i1.p1  ORF type:complete len:539 (-),score=88.75 TRINITY_DN25467_c0_g3_i1:378-1994(-)